MLYQDARKVNVVENVFGAGRQSKKKTRRLAVNIVHDNDDTQP